MVTETAAQTSVMVAEDDNDDFFIFSLAVERLPFAIALTRAEDGGVLMELLGKTIPDFLFLDVLMPCKDGMQCIREIRGNPRYDAMPVIVYTSLDMPHHVKFFHAEKANGYFHKPFSVDVLKDVLHEIFSKDWKKIQHLSFDEFVIRQQ